MNKEAQITAGVLLLALMFLIPYSVTWTTVAGAAVGNPPETVTVWKTAFTAPETGRVDQGIDGYVPGTVHSAQIDTGRLILLLVGIGVIVGAVHAMSKKQGGQG